MGVVEGIKCTVSYVEKTSHTCSLNFRREFAGVTEGYESRKWEIQKDQYMSVGVSVGVWKTKKLKKLKLRGLHVFHNP